jgi:hypothetical protein
MNNFRARKEEAENERKGHKHYIYFVRGRNVRSSIYHIGLKTSFQLFQTEFVAST